MAEKGKMRFIRKNGKIIPIKAKDPTKKQRMKNYKKYGDGANQASRIDERINAKATTKSVVKKGLFAMGAGALAMGLSKRFAKASLFVGGVGMAAMIDGSREKAKNLKKLDSEKENAYVAAFGVGSDGFKPKTKRKSKNSSSI